MVIENEKMIRVMRHLLIACFLWVSGAAYSQSVGGSLGSPDTARCTSVNGGTITLTGHTGTILRWEYSYSGGDPWTPIAHVSAVYNFSNLAQNTSFRVVVKAPGFLPATSSTIRIRVYDSSAGGSITAPTAVCSGSLAQLNLANNAGSILQWEESSNYGSTWTIVPGSAAAQQLTRTISQDLTYRVSVKNGTCPAVYSSLSTVLVAAPSVSGTIGGIDSVCASANSFALTLTGFTGTSLSWEHASSLSGPWVAIGETTATLNQSNIPATGHYRVSVKSSACPAVYSPVHTVHVSSMTAAGNIVGTNSVCENDTIMLNLVNQNGALLNWQESTNAGASWASLNLTSSTIALNRSAGDIRFRTLVKNGVCPVVTSPAFIVSVHQLPAVQFSTIPVCEDLALSFSNTTPGMNTYAWDFGDGTGTTASQPVHTYLSNGAFSVRLIATDVFGCADSIRNSVTIYDNPAADFLVMSDTVCNGDFVEFVNSTQLSQGTIMSYQWKLNGSVFATNSQPIQQLINSGNNTIQLKVVTSAGCTDSITKTVNVHPKPQADFTAANSCLGTTTVFQNLSQIENGTVINTWSFGDGNTSSLNQVQHQYTSWGSFNTQLIVKSIYLCADTAVHTTVVNPTPVIDFTFSDICLGDSAAFVSTVINANPATYNWNFGDGSSGTISNPTHVYGGFGTYGVNLNVTSDSGCVAAVSHNIIVSAVPNASFSMQNACVNSVIAIVNYSSIPSGTIQYAWDLGGQLSSDPQPAPVFTTAGIYTAQLVASSENGCSDTAVIQFTIFDQPVAAFSHVNVCYGFPMQFHETSTVSFGSISGVVWDFGDNSNSTLPDPEKMYLNEGDYAVQLIAWSSNGCSDTVVETISIYDAPIADFSVNNSCLGEISAFVNISQLDNGVYTSAWNFGDGGTSTLFAPNHVYATSGVYLAELVITSDQGCQDSVKEYVYSYAIPNVLAGTDATVDKGYVHQLQAGGAATYVWTPSEGLSNPQIANPAAQPLQTQTYALTGIDQHGCIGYDTVVITVNDTYKIAPYNIVTPDANGQNDTWIIGNIETYSNNQISIFNELGNEVYRTQAYSNTWEGRNKTGEILPDGTYYYVITFPGTSHVYKGDLLLIRNMH